MKTRSIVALVLVLSGIPGGQAWGQRFRFFRIPRPAPFRLPVRPPIRPPVYPLVHPPIHPPTSVPQGTNPPLPTQPSDYPPLHSPVHLPIPPPTSVPQHTNPSQPNQPSGDGADSEAVAKIVLVCFGIGLFPILVIVLVAVKQSNPSVRLMSPIKGLFGFLEGVFAAMKRLHPSGGLIRIISTPPGEASRSIRQAWIGVELPLAKSKDQGQKLATMEVLSWKPECTTGYAVEGREALKRLAAHAPAAAAWWRENVPHVLDAGYQFVFPVENCHKLG